MRVYSHPRNDLTWRFLPIVESTRLGLTWIVPGAIIAARTRLKK